MSTTLLRIAADLQLSLAAAVTVGQTTATLSSASDSDGVALPSGKYGFTVDGDTSAKEYIVCDLIGTALTGIQNISRQGAVTTGFANYHRFGATVTITDWAILSRMLNNLSGTTGFDSGTAIKYDGQPALSDPTAIPTVQYVLDTASGGPVSFNATVVAGDAGENVSDGDWVYFDTTDGEWYLTDADITAKCLGVRIGKARGAGTDGNAIVGGIFIDGLETAGMYVAGTTYYLSNTPGALATSAGTNSVIVGVGDANGELMVRRATPSQNDALLGTAGTPSVANKFVTNDDTTGTGLIQRASTVAYDLLAVGLTSVTVANTTTETTLFTDTVPANTLGTANVVRVRLAVSSLGTRASGTNTVSIRLKYGSTTVATASVGGVSVAQGGYIFADLFANAATNAQVGTIGLGLSGNPGTSPTGGGGVGTATEDSTGALALTITAQWNSAETLNTITTRGATLEVVK